MGCDFFWYPEYTWCCAEKNVTQKLYTLMYVCDKQSSIETNNQQKQNVLVVYEYSTRKKNLFLVN